MIASINFNKLEYIWQDLLNIREVKATSVSSLWLWFFPLRTALSLHQHLCFSRTIKHKGRCEVTEWKKKTTNKQNTKTKNSFKETSSNTAIKKQNRQSFHKCHTVCLSYGSQFLVHRVILPPNICIWILPRQCNGLHVGDGSSYLQITDWVQPGLMYWQHLETYQEYKVACGTWNRGCQQFNSSAVVGLQLE